jgi:hypothetical protein
MSYVRARNRYNPDDQKPFKISRSKLEMFLNCARCFYLDRRLGVSQPPSFPFNLNNAVDTLLKKEFDHYRSRGLPHPLMKKNNIHAVPFSHDRLDHWRDALRGGIDYLHEPSNLLLTGGVDDLWVNGRSEVIIVDYKATSKVGSISIDADWQISYKRQLEIYSWLFKKNDFQVSSVGYFVYCNALTNRANFDSKLEFEIQFIPYEINDKWVDGALLNAKKCLDADDIPDYTVNCAYCGYQMALAETTSQMKFEIE